MDEFLRLGKPVQLRVQAAVPVKCDSSLHDFPRAASGVQIDWLGSLDGEFKLTLEHFLLMQPLLTGLRQLVVEAHFPEGNRCRQVLGKEIEVAIGFLT